MCVYVLIGMFLVKLNSSIICNMILFVLLTLLSLGHRTLGGSDLNQFPNSLFPNLYHLSTPDYLPEIYKLGVCSVIEYNKCMYTLELARKKSIPLQLDCVLEEDLEACLASAQEGLFDMIVLSASEYAFARELGLEPALFAREDDNDGRVYVAVAPKNISLVELQLAPISFNESEYRASLAATFFNSQRGHPDKCPRNNGPPLTDTEVIIKIVDSSQYVLDEDEILICPDRTFAEQHEYQRCNVEAKLQRAVFVSPNFRCQRFYSRYEVKRIFDRLLQYFGETSNEFNFFSTFEDTDDVIFKNNTIAFDLQPTYRNGVTEEVYSALEYIIVQCYYI